MRPIPNKFNRYKNRTPSPSIIPLYVGVGDMIGCYGRWKINTLPKIGRVWVAALGEIGIQLRKLEPGQPPQNLPTNLPKVLKRYDKTTTLFWNTWWDGIRVDMNMGGSNIDFMCSRPERNFNAERWINEVYREYRIPIHPIYSPKLINEWIDKMILILKATINYVIPQDSIQPYNHFRDPKKRTKYDDGKPSNFEKICRYKYFLRTLELYKMILNGT